MQVSLNTEYKTYQQRFSPLLQMM